MFAGFPSWAVWVIDRQEAVGAASGKALSGAAPPARGRAPRGRSAVILRVPCSPNAMPEDHRARKLLDGYVGVKFEAVQVSPLPPAEGEELFARFEEAGRKLKAHGMTPENGGNMSVRLGKGFVITASGSHLGCLEKEDLILVERCEPHRERVFYRGPQKPSSESLMHRLIYDRRPEAEAVLHAHDEAATCPELFGGHVQESEKEEPYGTAALARMAVRTFGRAERIIVLKNHGYVAVGPDLESACDLVVATHLQLMAKRGKGR